MGTIVVGVDGSRGADEALDYAAREASDKDATLRIVSAWHLPVMAYGSGMAAPIDPEGFREAAETAARNATATVNEKTADLVVETVVKEGQAADILVEAAKDADLLVVGSRGLGGFKGLLLGSVSQQCAHYADCPLVIVRTRRQHG